MIALGAAILDDDDVLMARDPQVGGTSLDVTDAALMEPDAAGELARLRTRGFVVGAARGWASPEGSVVQVTLHRFSTQRSARDSVADIRTALRAAGGRERAGADGAFLFTVTEIHADGTEFRADVALVAAADVSVAVVVGSAAPVGPGRHSADALLARQRRRLLDPRR